jgi:hypothetical protein
MRRSAWSKFIYSLEPIPENFGYSLEGYSHRERCHAPDRNKSTKENNKELWLYRQQNIDYSHWDVFTKS